MVRTGTFAALTCLLACTAAAAQAPGWQFEWKVGQTLNYRVQHTTTVKEVVDKSTVETHSKLELLKRWQVAEIDAQGIATLNLSLVAMRNEQTRPNGEKLVFDSANLDKSTPELREMGKFLGKTLAVLRIDRYGRLHEVKVGAAAKYEAEPPFVLVLPTVAPQEGQAWLRPFNITLEPPAGAGEKHPAHHRYTCTKVENGQAVIRLATEFKKMPETPQERLPLLQKDTQGQVIFDIAAGRMTRAQLSIDKMIENHQGPGSSYHLVSAYTEELVNAP